MTPLPTGTPRAQLEDIFGVNVFHGQPAATIEFDAALLGAQRPASVRAFHVKAPVPATRLPKQNDVLASVAAVVELALYDGYPRIDWVAAKLEMSRRSFQRVLEAHGSSFNQIVGDVILRRAKSLLTANAIPVTDIALQLGYRDVAHFTRAFKRWAGVSPNSFRKLH